MNERNFHIYIVREGQKRQKNYFKIGSSSSCKTNRLSALQISNPRELFLVKKIKDNRHLQKLEPYLHKNLENYHKRGEWFYLNEDILSSEEINKTKVEIDGSCFCLLIQFGISFS